MRTFLFLLFYLTGLYSTAQTLNPDPYQNAVILQHYSVQDLQSIQQTDTVKYNTIKYYYTQSFIFTNEACNCTPLAIDAFDISQYEYLRQKNKRFTRHFEKYGFKVTFLSIDELTYKLPIHYAQ
ncbi:MAG: hypothetical protein V4677_14465 [Bacteroidota bacterium]